VELGLNWVCWYGASVTSAAIGLPSRQDLAARFSGADWSLLAEAGRDRQFHPYPARYVPALPRQVFELLDARQGFVLDPFCGSGTTLMEARRRGLASIGVDINPVACLISRVRTSSWVEGDDRAAARHRSALTAAAMSATEVGGEFGDIPRLDHWFPSYAQVALSGAVRYVRSLPLEDPWRDRVAASVSAATVKVSRQDSDTRYAAIEKAGDQVSVAKALGDALAKTAAWLQTHAIPANSPATVEVKVGDARRLSGVPDESVSVTCFSPPYPNAYEYWLYHKYRMYWLGFDAVAVREAEIGARPHYSKKNGLTEVDFARQMGEVFDELARVSRPGAKTVVVVGDSVIGGRQIDNGTLLSDVATSSGFTVDYQGARDIAMTRSSFNRAHSRGRRTEHVLVFSRRPA